MQNYLKGQRIINPNAYKNGQIGIVVQDEYEYWKQYYKILNHHRQMIDSIIPDDRILRFPIGTEYLENTLSGYKIEYEPFLKGDAEKLEGFRLQDPFDESKIHIFYNAESPAYKQRYTKIHETLHICQSCDIALMLQLEELLKNPGFPWHVVEYMLERATEKAVAMYMMPEKHFKKKYIENPDIAVLSNFFEASMETVKIRLQECKLPVIVKI